MQKKALFFDIDGTILSGVTWKVPKSAVDALGRAVKNGHLTFINTGRTLGNIPQELKELPFSGFVCGCGTHIMLGDDVLLETSIPHKRGREIIEFVKKYNASPVMEGKKDCYFPREKTRFEQIEILREIFGKIGRGIECYLEEDCYEYDKFTFCYDEQTERDKLMEELGKDMDLIDRNGGFYEVVPKGYSKASGIEFIRKKFGMDLDDIYVFGDSSNDLAMFQYAKHTIAMGDHDAVLEPYTEFVTKTVDEDGLCYAMEHYGLI